jgi:N-methylhydantoinase A
VGPRSAGAVPGPACYGQGGPEPTIADANLVLGILPERGLLGGKKRLDVALARDAIRTTIADPLGMSIEDAAAAIYTVQNAQTGDLLRKSVVEAGHDPRGFILYAFGGAGPAHCAGYAAEVGVRSVVVPLGQVASAFSAYGLAASNVVLSAELSDPAAVPLDPARVEQNLLRLETQALEALERQGLKFAEVVVEREIDMRFTAQLAEIATPVPNGTLTERGLAAVVDGFERRYAELYGEGTGFPDAGIQAITYRVRATGVFPFSPTLPEVQAADSADATDALVESRNVRLTGTLGYEPTAVYDYRKLQAGYSFEGPAIVEVPTTTVVVPRGTTATVDHLGNLNLNVA